MTRPVEEILDQHRWLMNNGLINDLHKDTLYLYGTLVHKDVQAVELSIDVESKSLSYIIYVGTSLYKSYMTYQELRTTTTVFGLLRLKFLLKRMGNLNFMAILNSFVKDYCGPNWKVGLEIKDFKYYEDGFKRTDSGSKNDPQTNPNLNKE
jgi:hypothetical protein